MSDSIPIETSLLSVSASAPFSSVPVPVPSAPSAAASASPAAAANADLFQVFLATFATHLGKSVENLNPQEFAMATQSYQKYLFESQVESLRQLAQQDPQYAALLPQLTTETLAAFGAANPASPFGGVAFGLSADLIQSAAGNATAAVGAAYQDSDDDDDSSRGKKSKKDKSSKKSKDKKKKSDKHKEKDREKDKSGKKRKSKEEDEEYRIEKHKNKYEEKDKKKQKKDRGAEEIKGMIIDSVDAEAKQRKKARAAIGAQATGQHHALTVSSFLDEPVNPELLAYVDHAPPDPAASPMVRSVESKLLPAAVIHKWMRAALPSYAEISSEALEAVYKSLIEFICFLSSEASDLGDSTITAESTIEALRAFGLEDYSTLIARLNQRRLLMEREKISENVDQRMKIADIPPELARSEAVTASAAEAGVDSGLLTAIALTKRADAAITREYNELAHRDRVHSSPPLPEIDMNNPIFIPTIPRAPIATPVYEDILEHRKAVQRALELVAQQPNKYSREFYSKISSIGINTNQYIDAGRKKKKSDQTGEQEEKNTANSAVKKETANSAAIDH